MNLSTADLEAMVAAAPRSSEDGYGTLRAWLSDLRIEPGRHASVSTTEAFVQYRRWCQERGEVALQPFPFARGMRMVLGAGKKKMARRGHRVIACFMTDSRSADLLRGLARDFPPTTEDYAIFAFDQLRKQPTKDTR